MILFSPIFFSTAQAQDTTHLLSRTYKPSRQKASVGFFLQDIQQRTGTDITYSSNFLRLDRTVRLKGREQTIREALATILQFANIRVTVLNNKLLLLPQEQEVRYYTVSGFVREQQSREVLIGATVYDPASHKGTITNAFGFYSLQIPDSCRHLLFSHVGYQPVIQPVPTDNDMQQLDVLLPSSAQLQTIIVKGAIQPASLQRGTVSLPIAYLDNLPALLGEKDVLKSLQLFPGTGSSLESSSNLVVRGGSPDQNLYLLDGVPIYHTGHLFGLFSIFNSDAIKDVQLYKEGFPSQYGGRISSVIDIRTKDGNMEEWHGKGTLSPLSMNVLIEGPLKKEKSSMQLTARRSLVDWLYNGTRLRDYGKYYLYDINFKLNHLINQQNRIYFSFYKGLDKSLINNDNPVVPLLEDYIFNWSNTTSALKWTSVINPHFFTHTSFTYSHYLNRFTQQSVIPSILNDTVFLLRKGSSRIRDLSIRNESELTLQNTHRLYFGGSFTWHRFSPTAYKTNIRSHEPEMKRPTRYFMTEFNLYLEDEIQLIPNQLKLRAGLHYGGLSQQGLLYSSAQPRLLLTWNLQPDQHIQASFSKMSQFIHLLTTPIVNLPTDLWVPSTANIKPEHSYSYGVGYTKNWKDAYNLGVNTYYKLMRNVITTNTILNIFDNSELWEKKVITGNAYSYGAELLLEKQKGRLTGLLSYTLSWSWREYDKLNDGHAFPYKDDRRHNLSVAVKYDLTPRLNVAATWKFASGAPFTLPQQLYPDFDIVRNIQGYLDENYNPFKNYYLNYLPDIMHVNSYRLPAVHHFDLGATLYIGKSSRYKHILRFGVYNVYNRSNPFVVSYDELSLLYFGSEYKPRLYQYSVFRALAYLSYSFKF